MRLKEGDLNTSYFYAFMKNRQAQNHITQIIDVNGEMKQDIESIKEEIMRFYKELLGTNTSQLASA